MLLALFSPLPYYWYNHQFDYFWNGSHAFPLQRCWLFIIPYNGKLGSKFLFFFLSINKFAFTNGLGCLCYCLLFFQIVASLCYFWHKNLSKIDHFCFLVNCSSCTLFFFGKGNEAESQNPHQTLIIINFAKPMLCHSLQCYHCLFIAFTNKLTNLFEKCGPKGRMRKQAVLILSVLTLLVFQSFVLTVFFCRGLELDSTLFRQDRCNGR